MTLKNTIITIPLVNGASEELTRLLSEHYENMVDVQFTTYVDAMGHTAIPMLVAIVTTMPEDTFEVVAPLDGIQLKLWDEPTLVESEYDNEEGEAAWFLFGPEEHNGRTDDELDYNEDANGQLHFVFDEEDDLDDPTYTPPDDYDIEYEADWYEDDA